MHETAEGRKIRNVSMSLSVRYDLDDIEDIKLLEKQIAWFLRTQFDIHEIKVVTD